MNNLMLLHKMNFITHGIIRPNCNYKNITQGQGRILLILNRIEGISTKELSEFLNIKVTSLNETLNKLQEKGYIEKRPSDKDKRVLLIYLTDKGREFKPQMPENLDIFDCLNDLEKEEFDKYLTLIVQNLHEKMKKENPERYEKMVKHREKFIKNNHEWFNIN